MTLIDTNWPKIDVVWPVFAIYHIQLYTLYILIYKSNLLALAQLLLADTLSAISFANFSLIATAVTFTPSSLAAADAANESLASCNCGGNCGTTAATTTVAVLLLLLPELEMFLDRLHKSDSNKKFKIWWSEGKAKS